MNVDLFHCHDVDLDIITADHVLRQLIHSFIRYHFL